MKLSENLSLAEVTKSHTAKKNGHNRHQILRAYFGEDGKTKYKIM